MPPACLSLRAPVRFATEAAQKPSDWPAKVRRSPLITISAFPVGARSALPRVAPAGHKPTSRFLSRIQECRSQGLSTTGATAAAAAGLVTTLSRPRHTKPPAVAARMHDKARNERCCAIIFREKRSPRGVCPGAMGKLNKQMNPRTRAMGN